MILIISIFDQNSENHMILINAKSKMNQWLHHLKDVDSKNQNGIPCICKKDRSILFFYFRWDRNIINYIDRWMDMVKIVKIAGSW